MFEGFRSRCNRPALSIRPGRRAIVSANRAAIWGGNGFVRRSLRLPPRIELSTRYSHPSASPIS